MSPQLRIREQRNISAGLAGLPPLLARVYAQRGIDDAGQLRRELSALAAPQQLLGINGAVALIDAAILDARRILIVGDFDADGATSTAVAMLGLRALGARNIDFLVPNRFLDGYGLTPEIVAQAIARGAQLIITVDNGIASHAGVAAARAAGVQVVVTDHHLPAETLPDADAIVNPQLPGCEFPSKALAGVGVMFYVLLALRAHQRQRGAGTANLAGLLDLVALGTVADVVPLDSNNRVLVHQGLQRIRAGQCRPGIRALLQVAKRDRQVLTASDLGFTVAPRLNAAGRIDDMSHGIRCLLTDSDSEALQLADELDRFNRERRAIEDGMLEMADAVLADFSPQTVPAGLCLFEEDWHQGVIGIVAGRIKERVHRPTICFARVSDDELKGSARSIPGVHIRDVLADIANAHPELLKKFGGHAMAAGMTLAAEHFEHFSALFAAAVSRVADEHILTASVWSDGELPGNAFTLENAMALRDGGPWGQSFPEPLFHGRFRVLDRRWLAEKHCRLRLQTEAGTDVEAIMFDAVRKGLTDTPYLTLTYRLAINSFNQTDRLQLLVEHLL